ncbi:unnamed protein product [Sphagnum troendelagicum]
MVAFRMAEMYPNFVKKVMISSSGVGFVSTSLDELLARSNLSSISELMLPSSVKGMKVFLANVTYKAMWLLNFILHDMLQSFKRIMISGVSASGKGTQCELIAAKAVIGFNLQITPFFKNKHFELCCFVMYKVHNISPPLTQQPSLNQ